MYGLVLASALAGLSPSAGPPGPLPWLLEVGLTGAQVRTRTEALRSRGYRAVSINAYNAVEENRFAVIYQQGKGAWDMAWALTPAQFAARAGQLGRKGYVPICLSGGNLLGAEQLSDVWLQKPKVAREYGYGLEADQMVRLTNRLGVRGYRPVWISSYRVNAANTYAVLWEQDRGVAWELKYGLSAEGFQDALDTLAARGYRPVAVSGLNMGGVVRYCAAWEKRKGAWQVRYGQTQGDLLTFARVMAAEGYRPVCVSGYNTADGDRFVSLWAKGTR
jgi:hypothetical protein